MTISTNIRTTVIALGALAVVLVGDGLFNQGTLGGSLARGLVADAEARLGRPLTPASVAGVARRTTRRAIRRTAVYAATLPVGCVTVVVDGQSLHQCGSTYYQPYNGQYVVVVVE